MRLWGNVRYNATDDRIEQVQNAPFQKSIASIKSKMRSHVQAGMTDQGVADALRYVLQLPSEDFVAKVLAVNDVLHRQGMTCVKRKNYFVTGDSTYKGINARFTDAEGYEFEVQFHTADSFKAKAQTHLLYKEMQLAQNRLEKEQQKNPPNLDRQAKLTNDLAKYTNAMREIMAAVNKPARVESLDGRS
ncbi:hypothetical protein ALP14_200155 [Pseudomonas amygdali pv. myricae]|nr:hypothetical protein ALP18_200329 [Pseudomonas amygdali pv. myricae]RMV29467.1 hypothetical protein ALP14_200155 [Pseudomonas amygdali pv. myricae]